MKMYSMKFSKSEKSRGGEVTMSPSEYPWGLSINLDAAALKKLGIDELPDAGDECMIHAKAKVVRVSQSAGEKKTDRSVELQITDMSMMSYEGEDDAMWKAAKKARKES